MSYLITSSLSKVFRQLDLSKESPHLAAILLGL
jgi:hypothetical protein